jgi:hypothetical protein
MDTFQLLGYYTNRLLDIILNFATNTLPSPILIGVVLIALLVGAYYMLKA